MKFITILIALIFVIQSQECHAQELSMFQGFWNIKYYEDDNEISKQEFAEKIKSDSESKELWEKSSSKMTVAYVAFAAELGFLAWQINRSSNRESQTVPLLGVLGTAIVAIGFSSSSMRLKKEAILKYNKNQDIGSIRFGPTHNGFGLVVNF